ncbi:O-antigen ligase family protein [Candidatus Peregrinibacteria bacterium]|nr:O-antigen ligase family protein [Candidatus Peregrinibacteria bacterium]
MNSGSANLWKKIYLSLVCAAPFVLIAGIFDYRFHTYFWPKLDFIKLFSKSAMFDFVGIADWYFLVIAALATFGFLFWKEPSPDKKRRWIYLPIILIALGAIIARFTFEPVLPKVKSFTLEVWGQFVFPAGLFFILIFSLREKLWIERFQKMLLLAFTILGILSIFEFFTNIMPGANRDFIGRLVWPYIDPFVKMKPESANWLAYLFGPIALLSIVRIIKQKDSFFEYAALAVSLAVLLLTQSYAGILITGILALIFLSVHLSRHARKNLWLVVLLIVIAAAIPISQTKKFQILLGNYKQENSIERRLQIYKFNWEAFKKQPWKGLGPANYQSYFRQNMDEFIGTKIPEVEIPPHPHNLAVFFWSELGLAGLIAIIVIYISVIFRLLRNPHKHPASFVFAYFLGHGIADNAYGLPEIALLFWIMLALVFLVDGANENDG